MHRIESRFRFLAVSPRLGLVSLLHNRLHAGCYALASKAGNIISLYTNVLATAEGRRASAHPGLSAAG